MNWKPIRDAVLRIGLTTQKKRNREAEQQHVLFHEDTPKPRSNNTIGQGSWKSANRTDGGLALQTSGNGVYDLTVRVVGTFEFFRVLASDTISMTLQSLVKREKADDIPTAIDEMLEMRCLGSFIFHRELCPADAGTEEP
jgi:hypothetical protein